MVSGRTDTTHEARDGRETGGARDDHKARETHDTHKAPARKSNPDRLALVRWAAGLGAVTAESLADRLGVGVPSARGRLRAAAGAKLLRRHRPLTDAPALYTATRAGMRKAGVAGLDPCGVTAANASHLIECARAAAALQRCYPEHRVQGERELRREERERGCATASAELGAGVRGEPARHRPDLVLWPTDPGGGKPVAVEVELTVKAPERLAAICTAWARARCVAGVIYLAPPEVERAVKRAIESAGARERVVVVPLEALPLRAMQSKDQ
jgi:hypothetical protein